MKGLYWGAAAIGTAEWKGVRLRDVMETMGITENSKNVKHIHVNPHNTNKRRINET